MMRRLSFALLFALTLSPAFGQAPPPVPALPDTERRTSYVISNSLCTCSVGFQIFGDSTDFTNWVEVFVNGARLSSGWTISSPTGSLSTIPRPITDAVLTFTVAQTGTVQIVGARRPRRASQFNEGTGVSTRNFNVVLTDLTAQNREVWDKINDVTGRSVRTPPGETLALLPVLASRANMGACFDSGGNLTSCSSIPTSTLIAGSGISLTGVGPTTIAADIAAGPGISFTGTHPITIGSSNTGSFPYILPFNYGAVCDGVTNDATALQAAINASVGKTLLLPAATCLTNSSLTIPSNVSITGLGSEASILKSTARPALRVTNASTVSLTNFQILGTNSATSWTVSQLGPIVIEQTASSVAIGRNYTIQNMKFIGWNSSYWMFIGTVGSTFGIIGLDISNNYWVTDSSSIPTDVDPFSNTNYLLVMFSATGGNGRIENVVIDGNRMEATGACFGVLDFANSYKVRITNNVILETGTTTPVHCTNALGGTNAYGVAVYDLNSDGHPATDWTVSGNYIANPKASGVYVVGNGASFLNVDNTARGAITNNLITGQLHSDVLLPRGAISVNTTTDVSIIGNTLLANQTAVNLAAQSTGTVSVLANDCVSNAGSSICLQLSSGANGSSNTDRRIVRGNLFDSATTTVVAASATGARFSDLDVSGNNIVARGTGVSFANQFVSGGATFSNNTFAGGGTNTFAALTGVLSLFGNIGLSFTAATLPAAANGSNAFVSDGAPASACTGASTGSNAFRQNGAWKCF